MSYSSNLDLLYQEALKEFESKPWGEERVRSLFMAGFAAGTDPENSRRVGDLVDALKDCSDYFHDFIETDEEETHLAKVCRAALKAAKGA